MQNTFGLEIYAANRQFFAGRACSLIIPAEDGQKEFLAHHANMICAIVQENSNLRIPRKLDRSSGQFRIC